MNRVDLKISNRLGETGKVKKKENVLPSKELMGLLGVEDENAPQMSVGSPAKFVADKAEKIANKKQQIKKKVKQGKPIETSALNAPEMKAPEKLAPGQGGISNTFVNALANFLPMVVGGLVEGSEGAVAAYDSAQQGMDAMQARNIRDREIAVREKQPELQRERMELQREQMQQQRDINLDRIRSNEKIAGARFAQQNEGLNRKEQQVVNKELSTLEKNEQQAQLALKELTRVANLFEDYSSSSVGGTGPLATFGGLKSSFSQPLEELEQAFNTIGVKEMTQLFQNMSKAIDSDSERKFFEKTLAGITKDDETNRSALRTRIEIAQELLKKIQERKQALQQSVQPQQSEGSIIDAIRAEKARRAGNI